MKIYDDDDDYQINSSNKISSTKDVSTFLQKIKKSA